MQGDVNLQHFPHQPEHTPYTQPGVYSVCMFEARHTSLASQQEGDAWKATSNNSSTHTIPEQK